MYSYKPNLNTAIPDSGENSKTASGVMQTSGGVQKSVFKILILSLLSLIFASSLSACSSGSSNDSAEEEAYTDNIYAMDTYMTFEAYGDNAKSAVNDASREIYKLDGELSVTDKNSEISLLNSRQSNTVSSEVYDILSESLFMSEETDGFFDITVYPIVKSWGFTTKEYTIPSESETASLLKHVGYDKISLSPLALPESPAYASGSGVHSMHDNFRPAAQVEFDDDETQIDTGAIAKGYASQRVADIFKKAGVPSGIVSLGGNIFTLGRKPDGSSWNVGIQNPIDTDSYMGIVRTHDTFLVTSGSYQRFFRKDGQVYHHIMSPFTGKPAKSDLYSVTIISDSGTQADALSTALFVMGFDKSCQFWRSTDLNFEVVFIKTDLSVYVTDGIADDFSLSDKKGTFEIVKRHVD